MAKTLTTRELITKIAEGDLKDIIETLRLKNEEMDTNKATRIFIACCNACNSHPEKLVSSEFLFVVNGTIDYISEPSAEQIVNYYKAAFYIVKYLCQNICANVIKSFRGILRPNFVTEMSSVVLGLYESCVKHVYNTLVFVCKETKDFGDVLDLATEYCVLHRFVVKNVQFLVSAKNMVKCLSITDLKAEDCADFYLTVVKLCDLEVFNKELCVKFANFVLKIIENCKSDRSDFEVFFVRCLKEVKMSQEYRCVLKLGLFSLAIGPESTRTKNNFKNLMDYYRVLENSLSFEDFSEVMLNFHVGVSTLLIYYQSNVQQWLSMDQQLKWTILNNLFEMCPNNNTYIFSLCSFAILCLVYYTIKHGENPMEFKEMALKILDKMEKVKYAKLALKCENTMKHWTVQFKSILFKISLALQKYTDKDCIPFLETLLSHIFYFEECKDNCNYTKDCLLMLAINLFTFKDYEKCLQVCAINFYFFLTSTRNLSICWAKSKQLLGDKNNHQKTTICKILESLNYLKMKGENFALSNLTRCKLLHIELKIYKEMWKSRTPIMTALKELSLTVENVKMLVQIIIQIFGDLNFEVHEKVDEILKKTLKDFKAQINKKSRIEHKIDLIFLTFINYQINFRRQLSLNIKEMEKSAEVQKEIDVNPKEKCEIVAIFSRLKLDNYLTIIKDLNETMDLTTTLMDEDFTKLKDYPNIHDFLIKLSHEFQLHLNTNKSIKAAEFALKIAELQNNPHRITEAISLIIQKTDPKKPYISSLITKADTLIKKLDSKPIILQFLISKSRALLYKDVKTSYEIYDKAMKLWEEVDETKEVFQGQLGLIRHKFIMLPCDLSPMDHNKYTAKDILDTLYQTQFDDADLTGNALQMCITFEIYEEIIKMYKNLRLPRHLRCYARKPLELSQSMILPMRCLVFLTCGTEMDILCNNYETATVKLNGISDILCIDKDGKSEISVEENLQNLLNNLKLDNPVKNQFCLSPGSPMCAENDFHGPECVKHRADCKCFFCSSVEFQRFFLVKTVLDAQLSLSKDDFLVARNYLQGGFWFFEYFKENFSDFVAKTLKNFDLVLDCDDYFVESYCQLLHLSSLLLMKNGQKNDALQILDKILHFLYPRKEEFAQFFITIVLDKLGYMMEEKIQKDDSLTVQNSETSEQPVTPESKFSVPKQLPIETPVIINKKKSPKTRRRLAIPENDTVEKRKKSKSPIRTPEPKSSILIPKIDLEEPESSSSRTRKTECPIAPDLRRKTRLLTQKLRKNAEKSTK